MSLTLIHRSVIPAQPNMQVVTADKDGILRDLLIAWLVEIFEIDGCPNEDFVSKRPITLSGKIDHLDYAIEYIGTPLLFAPDGVFESEAEFLQHLRRQGRGCR